VRELEHAIHRAVVLARATRSGDEVILEAQHFAFPEVTLPTPEVAAVPVVKQNLREATEAFQRETIRQALAQNHHNWAACARMLETDVANPASAGETSGIEGLNNPGLIEILQVYCAGEFAVFIHHRCGQ